MPALWGGWAGKGQTTSQKALVLSGINCDSDSDCCSRSGRLAASVGDDTGVIDVGFAGIVGGLVDDQTRAGRCSEVEKEEVASSKFR